ncbi:hypothetical protein DFH09DRAFT_1269713 [Mycena vulgaris]|nr:hypothetical protein DFH09DRAFT_1269713 [Mycena vulgaris]
MSLPEYGRYLGNKRWAGASEDQTQLKIVRPDIGFPGLSLAVASQDAETERKVPARIAPRPISRPLRLHEAGVPAGRMQDAGAGQGVPRTRTGGRGEEGKPAGFFRVSCALNRGEEAQSSGGDEIRCVVGEDARRMPVGRLVGHGSGALKPETVVLQHKTRLGRARRTVILPDGWRRRARTGVRTRRVKGIRSRGGAKTKGRIDGRTGKWRARIGEERDSGKETESRHDCVGSGDAGEGRDARVGGGRRMRAPGHGRGMVARTRPAPREEEARKRIEPKRNETHHRSAWRKAHRRPTPTRLSSPAHEPDSRCLPVWSVLPVAVRAPAVASVRAPRLACVSETASAASGSLRRSLRRRLGVGSAAGPSIHDLVRHVGVIIGGGRRPGRRALTSSSERSSPTSFMPNTSQHRARTQALPILEFLAHPTPEDPSFEATLGSARWASAVYDLK